MVTGFEIFGAVGTCVALLNLARQGYESLAKTYSDYRKAGTHILAAQRHCSQIYFTVHAWTRIWGLHIPMTDELYRGYWGEDGWNQIEHQLATVSIRCADLAAIISKALPDTETYQKIPEDDVNRARKYLDKRLHDQPKPLVRPTLRDKIRQAIYPRIPSWDKRIRKEKVELDPTVPRLGEEEMVKEIRRLEEHISKSTSTRKKVKYVLCSSEQLQGYLQALEDDFKRLERLVDKAWRLQHPSLDYKTSTLDQKRMAALTRSRSFLVQEAKEDRVATEELYSCCSGSRRAVNFEMSLLDLTEDSRSKRFHIFVPWSQYKACLEVSTVKICGDDLDSNELQIRHNFPDACDVAHEEEQSLLLLSNKIQDGSAVSLRDSRERSWFRLKKRAMHAGTFDLPNLRDKLDHLVAAERLELAYSIVETGLLLLGTSWLSALSNFSLKRFKADHQAPRYILDINERGDLLRTQLRHHRRNLHLYIFTIGILLVEIALARSLPSNIQRTVSSW